MSDQNVGNMQFEYNLNTLTTTLALYYVQDFKSHLPEGLTTLGFLNFLKHKIYFLQKQYLRTITILTILPKNTGKLLKKTGIWKINRLVC
jgi:hypothetical protein